LSKRSTPVPRGRTTLKKKNSEERKKTRKKTTWKGKRHVCHTTPKKTRNLTNKPLGCSIHTGRGYKKDFQKGLRIEPKRRMRKDPRNKKGSDAVTILGGEGGKDVGKNRGKRKPTSV